MGARSFTKASSQRMTSAASQWASLGTAHTQAAMVIPTTVPGAGAYHQAIAMNSATTARNLGLHLNGDSSGTLSLYTQAGTRTNPTSDIVPTAGLWTLLVISKAAGTVAPRFLMHTFATDTTVYSDTGGTVANRTAGSTTLSAGGLANNEHWNGYIAAVAQWNRDLSEAEMRQLKWGRNAWMGMFGRGVVTNAAEALIDLTSSALNTCLFGHADFYTSGTQPVYLPESPPGW